MENRTKDLINSIRTMADRCENYPDFKKRVSNRNTTVAIAMREAALAYVEQNTPDGIEWPDHTSFLSRMKALACLDEQPLFEVVGKAMTIWINKEKLSD